MSRYGGGRGSGNRDSGWRRTKTALLWACALAASFVFGAVALAPLLPQPDGSQPPAGGTEVRREPPARPFATSPPPRPEPAPSVTTLPADMAPSVRVRESRAEPVVQEPQPVEAAPEVDPWVAPEAPAESIDAPAAEPPRRARQRAPSDDGATPRTRELRRDEAPLDPAVRAPHADPLDGPSPPRRTERRAEEAPRGERAPATASERRTRTPTAGGGRTPETARPAPSAPRRAAPAGDGNETPDRVQPGESID